MDILTKVRENIKEFFKKNAKYIVLFLVVVGVIKGFDSLVASDQLVYKPKKFENKTQLLIKGDTSVRESFNTFVEKKVKLFVDYCNRGEFEKAFNLISKENKEYFGDFSTFKSYITNIFTENKRYSLQAYSKMGDQYIYQMKIFSDILGTGLTKQKFTYLDTKIAVKPDKNEELGVMLNVGKFLKKEELKDVTENDELRIDMLDSTILYNSEILHYEITNKTNSYLVIKDYALQETEVYTNLGSENRKDIRRTNIILKPFGKMEVYTEFAKFADDERKLDNLNFANVRFVEKYVPYTKQELEQKNRKEKNKVIKQYSLKIPVRGVN